MRSLAFLIRLMNHAHWRRLNKLQRINPDVDVRLAMKLLLLCAFAGLFAAMYESILQKVIIATTIKMIIMLKIINELHHLINHHHHYQRTS